MIVMSSSLQKGMAKKILKRYQKIQSPGSTGAKKKSKDAPQGVSNIIEKMRSDWETGNRNSAVFETYMDVLRTTRLPQALTQSAADHLLLYPCLSLPSVVCFILKGSFSSSPSHSTIQYCNVLPFATVDERI